MSQTWHTQWNDTRALRVGPVSWKIFRKDFADRYFPREKRKTKVEDIINLYQRGMSVQEYSLEFTKLSKYASSMVSNPRDEINHFMTGMSDDLMEEFRAEMLHDNMDISHLMVHAQQVKESRFKRKNRESKTARSYYGGNYKGKIEIQQK